MATASIKPLAKIQPDSIVAALPKADLHIHQEWSPRLDCVLAQREGRPSYDWHSWAKRLMDEVPPGMPRLRHLARTLPASVDADSTDENFVARVVHLLDEAAADNTVFVEVRFGSETILRPHFMDLFGEAERRVRLRYSSLRAEAVVTLMLWYPPEQLDRLLSACCLAASEGLTGIDLLYDPYDREANWESACRVAERAAASGLGITVHAGEFSTANIESALRVPGVTRIGHAVYAGTNQRLLELISRSEVTVECCLSCNVVLGAVDSYELHPIRQFKEYGIPVVLGSDDPVQICTTIGREYATAAALGFTSKELLDFTYNAIRASFTSTERKNALISELRRADPCLLTP